MGNKMSIFWKERELSLTAGSWDFLVLSKLGSLISFNIITWTNAGLVYYKNTEVIITE